jgi:hypothetical protein
VATSAVTLTIARKALEGLLLHNVIKQRGCFSHSHESGTPLNWAPTEIQFGIRDQRGHLFVAWLEGAKGRKSQIYCMVNFGLGDHRMAPASQARPGQANQGAVKNACFEVRVMSRDLPSHDLHPTTKQQINEY